MGGIHGIHGEKRYSWMIQLKILWLTMVNQWLIIFSEYIHLIMFSEYIAHCSEPYNCYLFSEWRYYGSEQLLRADAAGFMTFDNFANVTGHRQPVIFGC